MDHSSHSISSGPFAFTPSLQPINQPMCSWASPSAQPMIVHHELRTRSKKSVVNGVPKYNYPAAHRGQLYTPLVYPKMASLNRSRGNSLHTLCVALHIFQQYCQTMSSGDGSILDELQWQSEIELNGQKIASICLSISEDINQNQNHQKNQYRNSNRRKDNNYQFHSLKIKILQQLNWNINYTSFIAIVNNFFELYQEILELKEVKKKLDLEIQKQVQILMEQFLFLGLQPIQTGEIVIKRILKTFNFKINEKGYQLKQFLQGRTHELQINRIWAEKCLTNPQIKEFSGVWPVGQSIFAKIRPLKQTSTTKNNYNQSGSAITKFAEFRRKIINGTQQVNQFFKPFDIFTNENNKGKQNLSGISTRNTSFE